MAQIKHVSFDFWDTLAVGNPDYIQKRAEFFSSKYDVDVESVKGAIKKVKSWCDMLGEQTLTTIPHDTQYLLILRELQIAITELPIILANMKRLFTEHPPKVIIPSSVLDRLDNDDKSVSITCNTGLASGDMIYDFLSETDLVFDREYFSDEERYFKPHPLIVSWMIDYHPDVYFANEILHIGDNLATDGKLCELTGMHFVHFSKDKMNYEDIFNHPHYK